MSDEDDPVEDQICDTANQIAEDLTDAENPVEFAAAVVKAPVRIVAVPVRTIERAISSLFDW